MLCHTGHTVLYCTVLNRTEPSRTKPSRTEQSRAILAELGQSPDF